MCPLQLTEVLGSLSGAGPILVIRLPMRNSTKEGVRRPMARDLVQFGSRRDVKDAVVEGVNTVEK